MAKITLPNNWKPRDYQLPAWTYLENGGRHAELVWARRHGKDEVALHRTACAAFERTANYWHMLPEAAQALWKLGWEMSAQSDTSNAAGQTPAAHKETP